MNGLRRAMEKQEAVSSRIVMTALNAVGRKNRCRSTALGKNQMMHSVRR